MPNRAQSVQKLFNNNGSNSHTLEPEYRLVDNHTLDVFFGNGWENWTRFKKRGKKIEHVAGNRLSYEQYGQVLKDWGL